jgi:hypothetical protein
MKKTGMTLLSAFGLYTAAACGLAQAQTFELAPSGGYFRPSPAPLGSLDEEEPNEDDTRLRGGYGYGLRATWNTPGYYGFELGYLRSRARFQTMVRPNADAEKILREDTVTVQQGTFNFLIYFMPAGERLRPFMTGGLQIQQYGAPGIPEWVGGGSRTYGANYGGGLKIKIVDHLLVRFDVRDYLGGKPYDLTFGEESRLAGGIFRQLEGTLGIAITF